MMSSSDMHGKDQTLLLNAASRGLVSPLLMIGMIAIVASVLIGLFSANPEDFWRSYLTAFIFVVTISLGALFFTLVQHLTRAGWSVVLRRIAECVAANLVWIWILFLPIAALMLVGKGNLLYGWVDGPAEDHLLQHKSPYLNIPFWLGRSLFYFVVWALIASFYFKASVAQDDSHDVDQTQRMQRWAPLAMILFALTQSFASVDWIKSIDPYWFSTMFGVYFFAAGTTGFFAFLCITMWWLQRSGTAREEITVEHYHDAGKFLFAFGVVFWAYIAFSQYMLIWYANIPEETTWYLIRQIGGWGTVSILLLLGHFVIPFVALISKHPKRIKGVLAILALWLLLFHYVDIYWLVQPELQVGSLEGMTHYHQLTEGVANGSIDVGYHPRLLDLTCFVGLSSLYAAMTIRRLGQCRAIPVGDPRLAESLTFENM
jgi:hypothetical protein